jgi:hypothetical protein
MVLPADSVKMAFIAPLSGTFALTFEEQLKQFRAAADEVNAAGGVLGGKRIEILPFDNKGTPQETLIALNRATDHFEHRHHHQRGAGETQRAPFRSSRAVPQLRCARPIADGGAMQFLALPV